jgi:phage terminase large subunit
VHPGLTADERRRLKAKLKDTLDDPALFARRILRHDTWHTQREILRSVRDHRRTAVKACHASSKTFTAGEAVLWWVAKYSDGIALTTAPTWTQVERMMWGEIRKSMGKSLIKYPDVRRTELRITGADDDDAEENFAIGISTNQGVRFQGWHGRILVVIDEAVGVRPDIFEAIEGIRAGGDVRILMLLNPTVPGGYAYDAFTISRSTWNTITISGLNTPNTITLGPTEEARLEAIVRAGERGDQDFLDFNPRPYLITRSYIWEKYIEWGPGSPLFQARVLGQFPTEGPDTLYPLAWLERAKRPRRGPRTGRLSAGVDVAGPGEDETSVTIRDGEEVLLNVGFADADARGKVAAVLVPYREQLDVVNVDSIGIGYYFARHLESLGLPVQDINVQVTDYIDNEKYKNLKASAYWGVRDRLREDRLSGLGDLKEPDRLISQLASIHYGHNAGGQVEIESKKDMVKKRGAKSPDRAESLILSFIPKFEQTEYAWPVGVSHTTI